jgi:hypothetical protein
LRPLAENSQGGRISESAETKLCVGTGTSNIVLRNYCSKIVVPGHISGIVL